MITTQGGGKSTSDKRTLKSFEADLVSKCIPLLYAYRIKKGHKRYTRLHSPAANNLNKFRTWQEVSVTLLGTSQRKLDGRDVTVHSIDIDIATWGVKSPRPSVRSQPCEVLQNGEILSIVEPGEYSYTRLRRDTKEHIIEVVGGSRIEPLQKGTSATQKEKPTMPKGWILVNGHEDWYQNLKLEEVTLRGTYISVPSNGEPGVVYCMEPEDDTFLSGDGFQVAVTLPGKRLVGRVIEVKGKRDGNSMHLGWYRVISTNGNRDDAEPDELFAPLGLLKKKLPANNRQEPEKKQ